MDDYLERLNTTKNKIGTMNKVEDRSADYK